MNKTSLHNSVMRDLYELSLEASRKKMQNLPDGALCAWSCISDSLQTRISYLKEFDGENIECRLLEFKLELDGVISVLEEELTESGSSDFDNAFKQILREALTKLHNIQALINQ